jgi:hypothetical protein
MKETNVARKEIANPDQREDRAAETKPNEIRLLDEYELSLTGGGDGTDGWP